MIRAGSSLRRVAACGRCAGRRRQRLARDSRATRLRPATPCAGEIDWPRRYDHMQQHSGQHLLSQVFERLYGCETVSVHIGADDNTLDLDMPSARPGPDRRRRKSLAIEQVYAALPITGLLRGRGADRHAAAAPPAQGQRHDPHRRDRRTTTGRPAAAPTAAPQPNWAPSRSPPPKSGAASCASRSSAAGAPGRTTAASTPLLGQIAALYSSDRAQAPVLAERTLAAAKESQRRIDDLTTRLVTLEAVALRAQAEPVEALPGVQRPLAVARQSRSRRPAARSPRRWLPSRVWWR